MTEEVKARDLLSPEQLIAIRKRFESEAIEQFRRRAVEAVRAKSSKYQLHGEGSIKDDDVQAWYRGEVNAADEIATLLESLPAKEEGV